MASAAVEGAWPRRALEPTLARGRRRRDGPDRADPRRRLPADDRRTGRRRSWRGAREAAARCRQRAAARAQGEGEKIGAPAGGANGAKRSRGGFSVEFEHLGESDYRAKYVPEHRAIYVNLDHAQVRPRCAARAVRSRFRRLAYEVALTEYALALARELDARQWFSDTGDALFEIRDTIDRVAKLAAALYAD